MYLAPFEIVPERGADGLEMIGLVLEPVRTAKTAPLNGQFRRVGLFSIRSNWNSHQERPVRVPKSRKMDDAAEWALECYRQRKESELGWDEATKLFDKLEQTWKKGWTGAVDFPFGPQQSKVL